MVVSRLLPELAVGGQTSGHRPLRQVAEPGRELELIGGPFDGAPVACIYALYDGSILFVRGRSYVVQPDGERAIYLSPSVLP